MRLLRRLCPIFLTVPAPVLSFFPGLLHVPVNDVSTRLRAAPDSYLDEKQAEFFKGYLNKHHPDLLSDFADAFTEIGVTKRKKNAFSGGSFTIHGAKLVGTTEDALSLEVTFENRGAGGPQTERVEMPLNGRPVKGTSRGKYRDLPPIPPPREGTNPVDDVVRRMNRICHIVGQPAVTGKLTQMGIQIGGDGVGKVKENLYLNQVPHNRFVRQYFYDMAVDAAVEAAELCSNGKMTNRMSLNVMFPECNPDMDSYRIGTLLELTRAVAIGLAEQNLRVRVCVQASMGVGIFTGLPKTLSGVPTLLQRMDWQSNEGEENEGMVGEYVRFGAIGKDHVVNTHEDREGNRIEQDDIFLLVCPQNMVGLESSIVGYLEEMVEAAGDRPVIIINPDLEDKLSSQGQQSVRGRQARLDFANSFESIFTFQNIYVSGTSYFPILGSIFKKGPSAPWVTLQRRDLINDGGELYVPILSTEEKPSGELIMETIEK